MRRWIVGLLVPVLVLIFAGNVMAQEPALKLTATDSKAGDRVIVTVVLNESVEGNSVSVEYTYDERYFTPVAEDCKWVQNGFLTNFDPRLPIGVWGVQNSTDLKGGLCELVFKVAENAEFTEATVSCKVTVKDDNGLVGTYTGETKVKMVCEHSYGEWKDLGDPGHERECQYCHIKETVSHQWDEGMISPNGTQIGENVVTYTCQVCGGTKSMITTDKAPDPTTPEAQGPTRPQGKPDSGNQETEPSQKPTVPSGNQDQKPDGETVRPTTSGDHNHDHDHAVDNTETVDPHEGHDHSTHQEANSGSAIAVFALLAALIGGAVWFVKRKH